jgi:hypothetical protein
MLPLLYSDRNEDSHLDKFYGTIRQNQAERQGQIQFQIFDRQLPIDGSEADLRAAESQVFKFAAAHYIAIMQRAESKAFLPEMARYLKSYMNYRPDLAQWFLSQFVNEEMITESLLQCNNKFMRMILGGLIYCAMLKSFEVERKQLMNYWVDTQQGVEPAR